MDDIEWLRRLREGDEAAFDWFYRKWYAPLVRLAETQLKTRAAAEDVVQDVMLELWRRRENLAPDCSLAAYIYSATRNRVLSRLRHDGVRRRAEPQLTQHDATAPGADVQLLHNEIDAALQLALQEMPARCREVFLMNRLHGLKYNEIAEALNVSVKTIEADMGKALRHLRARLATWLPQKSAM